MVKELYSREIAAGIDIETMQRLKVFLGGAGNTGSHMVEHFLHNFVKNVFIVDFDKQGYEKHNFAHSSFLLHFPDDVNMPKAETLAMRANEKALEKSNFVGKTMDVKDIGPNILKHFDIVLGFFDNVSARKHLYEMSRIAGVPFLEVGISNMGSGQVQLFNHDKDAPCYCCTAPKVKSYQSCGIVYENDLNKGIVPNTDIAGNMVTIKAMRELMEYFSNPNYKCNIKHILEGETFTFKTYNMVRNSKCDVCAFDEQYDNIIEIAGSVDDISFKSFKSQVETVLKKPVEICLCDVFVVIDNCPVCGKEHKFMKPGRKITASDLICEKCRNQQSYDHMKDRIEARNHSFTGFDELPEELQQLSLYQLGYAYGDNIIVKDSDDEQHIFTMKNDIKIINKFI